MTAARILIADADEQMRAVYANGLVDYGFEVATAADGLNCIAALRDFVPTLLVLDPELPWGGGAGLLARMYEEADLPYVPVILLTANPWLLDSFASFSNCDCHFKPMAPSMLAYQIELSLKEPPPQRVGWGPARVGWRRRSS
jgi:DNA-binding response OmpR family regulator